MVLTRSCWFRSIRGIESIESIGSSLGGIGSTGSIGIIGDIGDFAGFGDPVGLGTSFGLDGTLKRSVGSEIRIVRMSGWSFKAEGYVLYGTSIKISLNIGMYEHRNSLEWLATLLD